MKNTLYVYKPLGDTPLEVINKLRKKYPQYAKQRMGYAGRLDPMAEGLLLLLVGEENTKRKKYEKLNKTYRFEILWGFESDTYDILGITNKHRQRAVSEIQIRRLIAPLLGTRTQKYPPYSSARVNGKPLFWWARENRLNEISFPEKQIQIFSVRLLDHRYVQADKLLCDINNRIALVKGDFRQKEILSSWASVLGTNEKHMISELTITCSSGTYVRALCHNMGKAMNTAALAYSITRTCIGNHSLKSDILDVSEN
ncbi:hypothetical protein C4564_01090 [Candidatus Microgenomates bacterium]|nr:MAG: hypothetical protein C4564_01090 [Candidatus Microgenomates bacterium]